MGLGFRVWGEGLGVLCGGLCILWLEENTVAGGTCTKP